MKTLSEKLDGEITIEKIHLKPFTTLVLKNVTVTDKNPIHDVMNPELQPVDTFFHARYVIANIKSFKIGIRTFSRKYKKFILIAPSLIFPINYTQISESCKELLKSCTHRLIAK
jgi:hypothetical protein